MPPPRRSWDWAHQKAMDEGGRCRICRSNQAVQLAHVIGREHDKEPPLRSNIIWKEWLVHPDRVVPLCLDHHQQYDAHQLDLLPWLTLYEVLQAVADSAAGANNGLENARIRLCPSAYVPAVGL